MSGEVDDLVAAGPEGRQVFTLHGAQEPYRLIIEQMSEGAATLSREGVILYANQAFARMLQIPLERVIGAEFRTFIGPADRPTLAGLIEAGWNGSSHGEMNVRADDASSIPMRLGLSRLKLDAQTLVCVVAADLTLEKKKAELHRRHADLEKRFGERTADRAASRLAALNMMDNAVAARQTTEAANRDLQQEMIERMQAEESQALLSTAVEQSAETIVITDAETLTHIFEPFFTTKELGKGTGLGLSMAYGSIKQHQGHIFAYSEPGHGTTFKLYLPWMTGEAADGNSVAVAAADDAVRGGNETILVAEDNAAVARGVRRTLELLGYTILPASDGQQEVETFEAEKDRIDLVMLDAVMPRMGGKEAAERIVALKRGQKLLFTSGYAADTGVVDNTFMLPDGINFIQKPYASADLARAVRKALGSHPVADVEEGDS